MRCQKWCNDMKKHPTFHSKDRPFWHSWMISFNGRYRLQLLCVDKKPHITSHLVRLKLLTDSILHLSINIDSIMNCFIFWTSCTYLINRKFHWFLSQTFVETISSMPQTNYVVLFELTCNIRKNVGYEFSVNRLCCLQWICRMHQFDKCYKIEQRFNPVKLILWRRTYTTHFHSISIHCESKMTKKESHKRIWNSTWVSCVFHLLYFDLGQMHSKIVTINPIGFRICACTHTHTYTCIYLQTRTMHSQRAMVR